MDIKILGKGCPKCQHLEQSVKEVLGTIEVEAGITKVKDLLDIMEYDILGTPALVVNGKVKSSGRLPSRDEIKGWILEEN